MDTLRRAYARALPAGVTQHQWAACAFAVLFLLLLAIRLAVPPSLHVPQPGSSSAAPRINHRHVPAPLPAIPPITNPATTLDFTPDQARTANAAMPFAPGVIQLARPFVFAGSATDRTNALTCLAAATYYEAGDDVVGEQAVAQVVLNRVRHPAFPKTVCGVVFDGVARSASCQFTFACDGSMQRAILPAAWTRAKDIATHALTGFVFKPVGTATHYHADYVVPYWRNSLAKLAVVHAHIFYRWQGSLGLPPAFTGRLQPMEPIDPRLIALGGIAPQSTIKPVGIDTADDDVSAPADRRPPPTTAELRASLKGNAVRLVDSDADQYILLLAPDAAETYEGAARALCKARTNCIVMGWLSDEHMPSKLPVLPIGMRGMSFLYRKSAILGRDKAYWNCRQMMRMSSEECIPGTAS